MDFNTAEKQKVIEAMPDGAVVPVHMSLRPGGVGEGGWEKRNKDATCLMLDAEFTVVSGEYARRKFWSMLLTEGETEGQQKAAEITRSRLRAILESARGINPADESAGAMAARQASGYEDFDGIRFWAVVGYEPAKGEFKAKNVLKAVVTPDRKGWSKLEQVAQTPRSAMAAPKAAVAGKPSWAQA